MADWMLAPGRRRDRLIAAVAAAGLAAAIYVLFGLPGRHLAGVSDRVDIIEKAATAVAVVATGLWALFTFVLFRTAIQNVELSVVPEIVRYRGSLRVVVVKVALRNAGRVMVSPDARGCELSVWRLPLDADDGHLFDLQQGELVVDAVDVLGGYDPAYPYEIEPQTTYNEIGAVVARVGDLLGIRVRFNLSEPANDAISEWHVVHVE